MRWSQIAVLVVAGLVGACAAAVPGYQPPTPHLTKYQNATPTGGGFDAAGTYRLSDQEMALDCKRLNGSITIKILHLRSASQRVEPSVLAASAQSVMHQGEKRPSYGENLDADLQSDRARLEALNRRLAEKKCPTFDIGTELAPGNTNPPKPVKPGRKA